MSDLTSLIGFLLDNGNIGALLLIVGGLLLFLCFVVIVSIRARRFGKENGQEELERKSRSFLGMVSVLLTVLSLAVWALGTYGNYLASSG